MKVLITSGGTREPIDGVRSITNTSTGSTGAHLAKAFALQGMEVDYCHHIHAKLPTERVSVFPFDTFVDLQILLEQRLSATSYDCIFHLAAVSDFFVQDISTQDGHSIPPEQKIESQDEVIFLKLARRPKLIDAIRSLAPSSIVVAFKLTNTNILEERETAVQKLFHRSQCDWVVHNELHQIRPEEGLHKATLYIHGDKKVEVANKNELASELIREMSSVTHSHSLEKEGDLI